MHSSFQNVYTISKCLFLCMPVIMVKINAYNGDFIWFIINWVRDTFYFVVCSFHLMTIPAVNSQVLWCYKWYKICITFIVHTFCLLWLQCHPHDISSYEGCMSPKVICFPVVQGSSNKFYINQPKAWIPILLEPKFQSLYEELLTI